MCPEWIDRSDRLANLQLLDGVLNTEKNATLPGECLTRSVPVHEARTAHVERHMLGSLPSSIHGFEDFYLRRRGLMLKALARLLSSPRSEAGS